ncbi:MAG: hypothetical protein PHN56_07390, partial [Candidatus Nanoarchaeia archaeon]|nr:hypothetical protein [Candidatus Nanoarchaeia archaeon]
QKKSVIKEFVNVCEILNQNNLLIKRKYVGQLHCKSLDNKMKFDIWTSYQESETEIKLHPVNFLIPSNHILPLKQTVFKNLSFNVPNNPTEVLNLLYKNWQTPLSTNFRNFKY